jgi:membrane protease YdiL (CAAX protease family)
MATFMVIALSVFYVFVIEQYIVFDYNIDKAIENLILLVVILSLSSKYPIQLRTSVEFNTILKYSLAGCAVELLMGFPYDIWANTYVAIPEHIAPYYAPFENYNIHGKIFFLLNLCLLAPFFEEILFRGFFYEILKNRLGIISGAIISAALFSFLHDIPPSFVIAISGLVYAYCYEKSGSIWGSIGAHSLYNTLWFMFVYIGLNKTF